MDGDIFPARAPEDMPKLHPLTYVPFLLDEDQIAVHVDRRLKGQVVIDKDNAPRIQAKRHGHIFTTLYSPGMRPISAALGAWANNTDFRNGKHIPTHPEAGPKDKIKEDASWTRTATWEIWRNVKGEICDQAFRHHDALLIFVLRRHFQLINALDCLCDMIENPPTYQTAGMVNPNCVWVPPKLLKAADVKYNRLHLWDAFPYPWVIDCDISRLARLAAHGKTPSVPGTKSIRAVPSTEVREQFARMLHSSNFSPLPA